MLKICGITNEDFAGRAAEAGVDYLGFIFASRPPGRRQFSQVGFRWRT